jgi:hypothetical protein
MISWWSRLDTIYDKKKCKEGGEDDETMMVPNCELSPTQWMTRTRACQDTATCYVYLLQQRWRLAK